MVASICSRGLLIDGVALDGEDAVYYDDDSVDNGRWGMVALGVEGCDVESPEEVLDRCSAEWS